MNSMAAATGNPHIDQSARVERILADHIRRDVTDDGQGENAAQTDLRVSINGTRNRGLSTSLLLT